MRGPKSRPQRKAQVQFTGADVTLGSMQGAGPVQKEVPLAALEWGGHRCGLVNSTLPQPA